MKAYNGAYIVVATLELSKILAGVTRIVDLIVVIQQVESCIATSINCLTKSKIEDISTEMLSGNSKRVLNNFVGSKDVWKGNI
jgi:hypothetical protein